MSSGTTYAKEKGYALAKYGYTVGGGIAFALATTSMVVLMPLLFEIAREGQVGAKVWLLLAQWSN